MEILSNDVLDLVSGGADSGKSGKSTSSATGPNGTSINCPDGFTPSIIIAGGGLTGRAGPVGFGGNGTYTSISCTPNSSNSGANYGGNYGGSYGSGAASAPSGDAGGGGVKKPTHVPVDEH